jgi:hypothetical protein
MRPLVAYIMLYGVGWTQRWEIAEGAVESVNAEIERVGRDETGHLAIVDPGISKPTTLVVSWRHVAAAVVLGGEDNEKADPSGPYR